MQIPSEAKKVFDGIIFDTYQWQQEMFDGTKSTFEMLKRTNTVEVIAIKDDKICLTHQSQPNKKDFYSLFGGRAEEGEIELDTAKRELLEESGMTSNNWQLYKTYQPIHKIEWNISTFIAKACEITSKPKLDAGEQIEFMEVTFDKFIEIVLGEKFWGNELVLDILRMKDRGTLKSFKEQLLNPL